jgi:hypothetical protein
MWKFVSATIKRSTCILKFIICFGFLSPAFSQQYVIADKDNTHPELILQMSRPAFITGLNVQRVNDYIEVSWMALREQDVRKYIIEYSVNGIDYQTAGEVIANNGIYTFKHHLLDNRPSLYRIRMEQLNGKLSYSGSAVLDGIDISPVQIYPTIIQGNMINVNAYWPVERINIFSGSGQEVFAKDVNGQRDYMMIVIPSLPKGMYWMNFYGQGWKTTGKFIVQ